MDERIVNNPFPGLRPFEEHEETLFFGRETAVTDLMTQLRSSRFLAVIGASGSGKSSLIKAGLLPSLYRGFMVQAGSNWRVALFRPGSNPIGSLAGVLRRTGIYDKNLDDTGADDENDVVYRRIIETTMRRSDRGLVDAVEQARLPAQDNLLIVVDQFEELFRFSGLERGKEDGTRDSAAFIKLLLETRSQTRLPIYIILTTRSDFLGDCTTFMGLPEAINKGQYLVPRMTREEKRAAISGPVAVGGGEMSTPLMSRLLNDVGDNPDQLPILQHALMRTWDYHARHSRGGEPMDIHHYEAIGGMEQALSQHAEEAFAELENEKSGLLCEKLFKLITDTGETGRGVRRPARVDEICKAADVPKEKVIEVIDLFRQPGRTFLMPPHDVELNEDSVIDISHESFMRIWARLTDWVKEEGQSAELYGRLAKSAALYDEGKVGLWRDPELMRALKWREEEKPNEVWARRYDPSFELAVLFLDASKKQHDQEIAEKEREQRDRIRKKEEERREKEIAEKKKKYTRIIFSIVGFAVICLAILTIYAFQQKAIAVKESLSTKAYELSARSANLLEKDPTLSFRLAEAAFHTENANPEAYHRLLDAYYKGEFYRAIFHHDNTVKSAGFSADGKGVVIAGREKTRQWDFDGKEMKPPNSASTAMEPKTSDTSSSGKTAAISEKPGVALVRENGGVPRELKGHTATVNSVLFSSGGEYILTVADDNTARLWNITAFDNRIRTFPGHTSERFDFYAVFSPDGSRILTVTSGKAILWDLQGNPVKQAVPADDLRLETPGFSPGGEVILFRTDSDEKIGCWDLDRDEITTLELKGRPGVNRVTFSPDPGAKTVLTANRDNNARLWDFSGSELKELALFAGHTNDVQFAAFSPDGKNIVTASWDKTARLWDLNGKEITRFEGHEKVVYAVAVSKDGNDFLTASGDGTAGLWDRNGNRITIFEGHTGEVRCVAFSADKKYIITGSTDKTARLWNRSGVQVYEFKGFDAVLQDVSYSPGGKHILIAPAKGPAQLRLVDPEEIIRIVNKRKVWKLDEAAKNNYNL